MTGACIPVVGNHGFFFDMGKKGTDRAINVR